jgi:hypothetical protein
MLPADLRPGAYDIRIGIYDAESGARVPAQWPGEEPTDYLLVRAIQVNY